MPSFASGHQRTRDKMCKKEDKKCGSCAFMLYEDTYGYGSCPFDFGELKHCDMNACQHHIERDKVRHSAAVLAQYRRFQRALTIDIGKNCIPGVLVPMDGNDISDAIETIVRYINVITKKI